MRNQEAVALIHPLFYALREKHREGSSGLFIYRVSPKKLPIVPLMVVVASDFGFLCFQ